MCIRDSNKTLPCHLKIGKYSRTARVKLMKQKSKNKEKLEDMSNDELLALQDGFIQLRCHANRGLERIAGIMHDRLETQVKS